jgi:hypothetical protein
MGHMGLSLMGLHTYSNTNDVGLTLHILDLFGDALGVKLMCKRVMFFPSSAPRRTSQIHKNSYRVSCSIFLENIWEFTSL